MSEYSLDMETYTSRSSRFEKAFSSFVGFPSRVWQEIGPYAESNSYKSFSRELWGELACSFYQQDKSALFEPTSIRSSDYRGVNGPGPSNIGPAGPESTRL